MNTYRSPIGQQVGTLQEENRTTLEQVKSLEDIIASREIKLYKSAQLQQLYIIKLKRGICMLETNVNNFSEGVKDRIY